MNKITYTIVSKNGEDFKTFGFGGFSLTEKKTIAQALVDGTSKERATVRGLYATCVALSTLAEKFNWRLSSKVSAVLVNENLTKVADEYERATEELSNERKTLARLTRNAERVNTIHTLGGRSEESEKRLTALGVAIREQQQRVATAKTFADNARANLLAVEFAVWESQQKTNETNETNEDNNANNGNK